MFKNRFLLVLGVFSLLLVTLAVSRPFSSVSIASATGANDFYQRHPDSNRNLAASDYYARHPELSGSTISAPDTTSDFALRHPQWTVSVANAGTAITGILEASDYFQRHPELRPFIPSIDLSDYFLRH